MLVRTPTPNKSFYDNLLSFMMLGTQKPFWKERQQVTVYMFPLAIYFCFVRPAMVACSVDIVAQL